MNAPRPALSRAVLAGPLLVIVGVACWVLFVLQSRSEQHAFNGGANPRDFVRVAAGRTYAIAIHGGVRRLTQLGLNPEQLRCTAAPRGGAPQVLRLTTETSDTKANNQIATFVAGVSGDVQVRCSGIGAVYVDNAEDSPFDWSGLWLVLASLTLVVGLPLMLSALRSTTRRADSADRPVREYDEVK